MIKGGKNIDQRSSVLVRLIIEEIIKEDRLYKSSSHKQTI